MWNLFILLQLYLLFLIFILKLINFSFIKLLKIVFYERKSVAHYSWISHLCLRISNNYLTLSGFRFAKTLGSSIFSLNTWPTCKKLFRSRNFFEKIKLKLVTLFCRYPDNLHSTVAMTFDTLSHSTPRFYPKICCNSAIITVEPY